MYPRRIVLSEPSTPRILMPAVWVLAITVAAFAIVAGSSHVRAHRASTKPVAASAQPGAEQQGRVRATLQALPLAFEANQGQTDPQVKYMARGNGYKLFLTSSQAILKLSAGKRSSAVREMMLNKRRGAAGTKTWMKKRADDALRG